MNSLRLFLILVSTLLIAVANAQPRVLKTQSLFDGKSLSGWKESDFSGHGESTVKDGVISMPAGTSLTGVTWTNPFPTMNFEVELDAMKVEGSDFFCGLTFPVGKGACTFIVGGWGGGVVGISSIDHMDASENEATRYMAFKPKQWYHIRARVTPNRIQCWIDKEEVVDVRPNGREISLRAGEIYLSQPFGIAAYQTEAALKNLTLKTLDAGARQVELIAGKKSHGPGEHEYEASLQLLKEAVEKQVGTNKVVCTVHTNGWPADPKVLETADAIIVFSDGADHNVQDHPLLQQKRMDFLDKLMERGTGFGALHYTVFVPKHPDGARFFDWIGGYFDYESGTGKPPWFSKIENRDFKVYPATNQHPVLKGVGPFEIKEEFYYNQKLFVNSSGWKPLLSISADPKDTAGVVGWAIERPNGGRGVGYTGGHYLKNWSQPQVQRFLINTVLWLARVDEN